MFKKRIAVKLTAGLVIIVLISMLAIGLFFIEMFRQYAFDSREKTLLANARSISGVVAGFVQGNRNYGQVPGFGGYMRSLDTLTESKVWITDSKGNLLSISGTGRGLGKGLGQGGGLGSGMGQGAGSGLGKGTFNSEPLPEQASKVIQDVLKGQESVSESFSSVYNEATLTVGVPIFDSNHQIIGAVLLHSPVTGITDTLYKAVSILAVSLIAALILAVGLGIFYSLRFTRPLKAMNRAALEITRGNYSIKTGVNSPDELGQLGNSLDLLASELGTTINQLFQEKGKLKDIIASISEGIVAFDTSLRPVSGNNALAQIMNRPQPYLNADIEKDLQNLEVKSQLIKVMQDKMPSQILKDWLGKKLMFTFSPIIDTNGEITGCVALVQDISEKERLEQLRRDFVANVSHEFRTPLTVIRGSLEALLEDAVDQKEDIERYHQRMLAETRGLERLVGDLLELSRLQSGKITMQMENIYLPGLLADAVKSLQTIAQKKGIKIEDISMPDLPPVLGDYDRLRQLLIIFLDNAIKYSPNDTKVSVKTSLNGDKYLAVIIEDHGYGIAEEELPHIWERFYQADKSRQGSSNGLGLAIARHLLELHKAQVKIASELNKGTVVEIIFPLAASS